MSFKMSDIEVVEILYTSDEEEPDVDYSSSRNINHVNKKKALFSISNSRTGKKLVLSEVAKKFATKLGSRIATSGEHIAGTSSQNGTGPMSKNVRRSEPQLLAVGVEAASTKKNEGIAKLSNGSMQMVLQTEKRTNNGSELVGSSIEKQAKTDKMDVAILLPPSKPPPKAKRGPGRPKGKRRRPRFNRPKARPGKPLKAKGKPAILQLFESRCQTQVTEKEGFSLHDPVPIPISNKVHDLLIPILKSQEPSHIREVFEGPPQVPTTSPQPKIAPPAKKKGQKRKNLVHQTPNPTYDKHADKLLRRLLRDERRQKRRTRRHRVIADNQQVSPQIHAFCTIDYQENRLQCHCGKIYFDETSFANHLLMPTSR